MKWVPVSSSPVYVRGLMQCFTGSTFVATEWMSLGATAWVNVATLAFSLWSVKANRYAAVPSMQIRLWSHWKMTVARIASCRTQRLLGGSRPSFYVRLFHSDLLFSFFFCTFSSSTFPHAMRKQTKTGQKWTSIVHTVFSWRVKESIQHSPCLQNADI